MRALLPGLALLLAPAEAEGADRFVALWWADGNPPPRPGLCSEIPPAFPPDYVASTGEREVFAELERIYAPLAVRFGFHPYSGTSSRPPLAPEDEPADVLILSAYGGWCRSAGACGAAGLAPQWCGLVSGGTGYAFDCAEDGTRCARIVAHEHGHLLGLEHTGSPNDVMHPSPCSGEACGFLDAESAIVDGKCGRAVQNSYQTMVARVGLRGGPGPTDPPGCGCSSAESLAHRRGEALAAGLVVGLVLLMLAVGPRRSR